MKKRLLGVVVAVAMVICSLPVISFAETETGTTTATFDFSSSEFQTANPIQGGENLKSLSASIDGISIAASAENGDYSEGLSYDTSDGYLEIFYKNPSFVIEAGEYRVIESVDIYLDYGRTACSGFQHIKNGLGNWLPNNYYTLTINDSTEKDLNLDTTNAIESYKAEEGEAIEKINLSSVNPSSTYVRIAKVVVTYVDTTPVETTTPTTTGANTGDSNNIALYSIVAILALAGAGFVYKRREN